MLKKYIFSFVRRKVVHGVLDSKDLVLSSPSQFEKELIDRAQGGWSIDSKLTEAILSFLRRDSISNIIEFGAGYSSLVLHIALLDQGREVNITSIDENANWFKVADFFPDLNKELQIHILESTVEKYFGDFGLYYRYDLSFLNQSSPIDFVLIDGPQQFKGREGNLDFIYNKLADGCLIILDDAGRYLEASLLFKWLKVYQGLDLVFYDPDFGSKGLAILKVNKTVVRKFSPVAFVFGFIQGYKRFRNKKNRR